MSSPPFVTPPEGVRRRDIDTPRGVFAALEALPATDERSDARRPALLVPGYTGSKEDFIAVVRPLADAGHHVVAVDMRGQCESPGPDDRGAYSMAALGADVAAVAETLDLPVHLVGHSLGGLVSREVALTRHAMLASLTMLDSGPAAVGGPRAEHSRLLAGALEAYGRETVWQGMETLRATDPGAAHRSPEVVEFEHRRFLGNTVAGMLGMADALLTEPDRTAELAAVDLPTLVAYGERDETWLPEEQASMAKRLGVRREAFTGVGHSPAAEAPEAMARAVLGFWRSVEAATQEPDRPQPQDPRVRSDPAENSDPSPNTRIMDRRAAIQDPITAPRQDLRDR